jgi:hypothetical protein
MQSNRFGCCDEFMFSCLGMPNLCINRGSTSCGYPDEPRSTICVNIDALYWYTVLASRVLAGPAVDLAVQRDGLVLRSHHADDGSGADDVASVRLGLRYSTKGAHARELHHFGFTDGQSAAA